MLHLSMFKYHFLLKLITTNFIFSKLTTNLSIYQWIYQVTDYQWILMLMIHKITKLGITIFLLFLVKFYHQENASQFQKLWLTEMTHYFKKFQHQEKIHFLMKRKLYPTLLFHLLIQKFLKSRFSPLNLK